MTGTNIRNMLAKRLKILRREKGFSQAQLAEKADISVPFLSSIERGAKWPYPETLAKLADALDYNYTSDERQLFISFFSKINI
ncbi:MAG: helix-turn-helix domain-containing protein [Treponema sp.]|uniref:helix-turn-helix domain-containing protein n=1 Tax=Treponema sp. TaxID=166 RepID=UPI003FA27B12